MKVFLFFLVLFALAASEAPAQTKYESRHEFGLGVGHFPGLRNRPIVGYTPSDSLLRWAATLTYRYYTRKRLFFEVIADGMYGPFDGGSRQRYLIGGSGGIGWTYWIAKNNVQISYGFNASTYYNRQETADYILYSQQYGGYPFLEVGKRLYTRFSVRCRIIPFMLGPGYEGKNSSIHIGSWLLDRYKVFALTLNYDFQ